VNCSNTFQGQSGASRGDILRQSGGRRLFAFFDPVEPAIPAAPQLVSAVLQPTGGALVTWLEPDNGGSPITAYKIYRGTASGAETFLATVDASQTKYLDSALPIGAANVFYYVTAVNAQGESTHCREVSLVPATVGGGNTCNYPFLNVDGPGTAGAIPDATGQQTIQYVNIGEPFTTCADNSITFLMKVATLDPANTGMAVLPQNTEYQIYFGVTDTNGNPQTVYVEMDTNCPATPANPAFTYGRRDPSATGGTLDSGECTNQPPTSSCPRITGSYNKDGTILIKLDTSTPITFTAPTGATGTAFTWDARKPGTKLTGITGDVVVFAGCGAGFLENASLSSGGAYTRKGNTSCQNTPPIAGLTAAPLTGKAPLNVNFNATTSREPTGACGTINSYTIDFGDGTSATNATGMFTHTYTADGEYPARVTVSDTVGQASTNVAQVIISVAGSTPNITGVVSRKAHAGVGNFDVVLPLTGTPATEPRSGGAQGNHTIVIGFENTLASVGSVTATAQTQSGTQPVTVTSSNIGTDPHQFIVNLSGVPDVSIVTVTLTNAADSKGATGTVAVKMGALYGDGNGDGTVNAADATQTRNLSGQIASGSSFRTDYNLDGVTNSADSTVTRNGSGHTIIFTPTAGRVINARAESR
ncbi:MAG: PKD domain-containing protein, partial [Verrucomicrobiota bacterium]|nr:PKD domain-containing protein [Verrucomicrobiota bacterium]